MMGWRSHTVTHAAHIVAAVGAGVVVQGVLFVLLMVVAWLTS